MRILYAIQGTGNGHLSRSADLVRKLREMCEVDVLLSGIQVELKTDIEPMYRMHGMSFIFGERGGIDMLKTFKKNSIKRFVKELRSLPVRDYDLVLNDFEPISAWAAFFNGVPCYSVSNQCVTLHKKAPKSRKFDLLGKFILKHYAPSSAAFGFHLDRYAPNIYHPIIRDEFRFAEVSDKGHYTVYLAAYSDEHIIKTLSRFPKTQFQVFSKRAQSKSRFGNISIEPINNTAFIESFTSASGIICNSGFQTLTEALFLGKKLLAIPMKSQFEQQCIAEALKALGGNCMKEFGLENLKEIADWIDRGAVIRMDYQDQREQLLRDILLHYVKASDPYTEYLEEGQYSVV